MTGDVGGKLNVGLRTALRPGLIVAILAAALFIPVLATFTYPILAASVLLVVVSFGWMWWPRTGTDRWWRRVRGSSVSLLLQMSPVILLTTAFPFATERMAAASVGGVQLTAVVLAASLTVPWLAQAVSLPLYRGIGQHVWQNDIAGAQRRFMQTWPVTALQTLPVVVLFAVVVQVFTGWSWTALGAYVVLSVLNGLYAQSLVIVNVAKKRIQWASAWAVYAVALLVAPTLWYLPPLLALAVPLYFMRNELREVLTPDVAAPARELYGDVGRGLLTGTFLWADKLFIFLRFGIDWPIQTVFIALLPAVVVYNYYFTRMAAPFDAGVANLRSAMEQDDYASLNEKVKTVASAVVHGLEKSALMAATLSLFAIALLLVHGNNIAVAAPVAVASCAFLLLALASYKLEYMGRVGLPMIAGAGHLVGTAVAFSIFDSLPVTYGALIAVDAILLVVVVRTAVAEWKTAEYTLFWRHATAW